MNEDVEFILEDAREKMDKAVKHLESDLLKLRAGKANTHILDGINVDYYGVITPLVQVSNISTPDARTIAVQPWDKKMIEPIEKAILASNIGLTPANNGELIRLNIPPLTEERRRELTKQVKHEGEATKVTIRNLRREAINELKKMEKDGIPEDFVTDGEHEVQKLTDNMIKKVDDHVAKKDLEIMTV
jgi:ribosome recycling factor